MNTSRRSILAIALLYCIFAAAGSAMAAPGSEIFTFRRVFQSSTPEFIEMRIWANSDKSTVEIRQLDEEPGTLPFEISSPLRMKIFQLVAQLNHFQGLDLDVHRKIAYLGEKTFRWENGSEFYEAKFNYTLNAVAAQLLQICEGLARQEQLAELIQRRMKYDRLGVNDALLQLEVDLSKGVLPEPHRLLPLLDQIAGDPRYVDIARQRARALAERLRHLN